MRLGAVVLAAGLSRRFGSNKLLADIGNRPMVSAAIDAVMALGCSQTAAVVSDPAVARYARERGLDVIANDHPELGQSHSIALAVQAMQGMDALLLLAGDMPRITGESLRRLADAFARSGKGIACLEDETHYGNPAVFSAAYFGELLAIDGDRGAKRVLLQHEQDVCRVKCIYSCELADADSSQALTRIMESPQFLMAE